MNDDAIESPSHYNREGLDECRNLIAGILNSYSTFLPEDKVYYLGNVIKYIYRAPEKGKFEDLKKAERYLRWIVNEET